MKRTVHKPILLRTSQPEQTPSTIAVPNNAYLSAHLRQHLPFIIPAPFTFFYVPSHSSPATPSLQPESQASARPSRYACSKRQGRIRSSDSCWR